MTEKYTDYTDANVLVKFHDATILRKLLTRWLVENFGVEKSAVVDSGIRTNGPGVISSLHIYVKGDYEELVDATMGIPEFEIEKIKDCECQGCGDEITGD